MKKLLILGGGTAGTMVANRLGRELDSEEWQITLVDPDPIHYYQPGLVFVPFGIYKKREEVIKPRKGLFAPNVRFILSEIDLIEPDQNQVRLKKNNTTLSYDYLIIATGTSIQPDETPGLLGDEWHKSIFDFYTADGAFALAHKLRTWEGGHLVLNIVDTPIKCPVAPLEFIFLADWFLHEHGLRDKVEITFTTPLPEVFTKPRASAFLGNLLEERRINVETEYLIEEADPEKKVIRAFDGREVPFDLLVTIPLNMGSEVIERSDMGDDLNYVPTEKHTLRHKTFENIFVLGDATDLPTSKAGSVAHFQSESFIDNFLRYIDGMELLPTFDGHSNCYIETGYGKGTLIDFNYDVEPLPGKFPLPGLGPFSLLEESRVDHWGKLMFRWIYWHLLLKGKELPIPVRMSMAGKRL